MSHSQTSVNTQEFLGNGFNRSKSNLNFNNLSRHKVTLRTDGGIKIGRDVVIAATMGAEEFGMGISFSVTAMGCIMVRQCHLNTCPVGGVPRRKFKKKIYRNLEKVVNFFRFVAEEVRGDLASLGYKNLNEILEEQIY